MSSAAAQAPRDIAAYCAELGRRARAAARRMAAATTAQKNAVLRRAADTLASRVNEILTANDQDVQDAQAHQLTSAQIDRLRLTPERVRSLTDGVFEIANQPDPVGRILEGSARPNGLRVTKVSVPLGVIFFIYESRPNVTIDAATLAIKSGNAIILRGGKEASQTNAILHSILTDAMIAGDLPVDAVQMFSTTDRSAIGQMLKLNDSIDLVIPRGGEGLIEYVCREAAMPVLKHYRGNCHVYVDQYADLEMAKRIVENAKCQRPGVCNAAESLLVHVKVADQFLPGLAQQLTEQGVELRGCERTQSCVPNAKPANDADYDAEYLDLILSIKVVDSLESAAEHIARFGSAHTDAIVTNDLHSADRFTELVDSSAVMVNASTRFNDGFELGLGAEIGISTDKLHARGPCGLQSLTSYKYVVRGDGHIRI